MKQVSQPSPQVSSSEFDLAAEAARTRWPHGFVCRRCGGHQAHHLRSRPRVFQCADCRCQVSVTAGSLLHGAKLPLSVWDSLATRIHGSLASSALSVARALSMRYSTIWRAMHRLRAALPSASFAIGAPTGKPLLGEPVGAEQERLIGGSAKIPLVGLPFHSRSLRMFNQVNVVAAIPEAATHEADWRSHVRFSLPSDPAVCAVALAKSWHKQKNLEGPAPELRLATGDWSRRLWGMASSLRAWLGSVHRQVGVRWFSAYIRVYGLSYTRRSSSPLCGVLVAPRRTWRDLVPAVPPVTTSASAYGLSVPVRPRWPPVGGPSRSARNLLRFTRSSDGG